MFYIIIDVKGYIALILAVVSTVVPAIAQEDDHCSFQNLVSCTSTISVITDSGLSFLSSKTDLDKICPNLKDAIKCIHGFTRHCMNKEDRLHFRKLFYGTGSMIHDLCRSGRYQSEYLKHAPCMTKIVDNELCFDIYKTAMDQINSQSVDFEPFLSSDVEDSLKKKREIGNEGIKNVCCAFQHYVECSTSAVERKCGDETARFSKHFLKKMSSSMLNVHCMEFESVGCGLIKIESGGSRILNESVLPLIMSLVIIHLNF